MQPDPAVSPRANASDAVADASDPITQQTLADAAVKPTSGSRAAPARSRRPARRDGFLAQVLTSVGALLPLPRNTGSLRIRFASGPLRSRMTDADAKASQRLEAPVPPPDQCAAAVSAAESPASAGLPPIDRDAARAQDHASIPAGRIAPVHDGQALADEIAGSDLFDADFYVTRNQGHPIGDMSPALHYILFGAARGIAPSERFDGNLYLELNADVQTSGMNPLIHYLRHGRAEGRPIAKGAAQRPPEPAPKRAKSAPAFDEANKSTFSRRRLYEFAAAERLEADRIRYFAARADRCRVGIFTANVNAYESIKYHEYINPGHDYILYTDQPPLYPHVYTVRPVPLYDQDPTRRVRYIKNHPHLLMADYEVAVWIDSNILIRGDIEPIVQAFKESGEPIGTIPHPLRRSVYEEGEACIKRSKDDAEVIRAQMLRYRQEGFDCDTLVESCMILYRIGHPQLMPAMANWWKEIDGGSRRDQLSFNIALARAQASFHPVMQRPVSARNHPALAFFHHDCDGTPISAFRATGWEPIPARRDDLECRIGAQAERSADIVICVHNAPDWVRRCLASVAATRNAERHRIILIDDGSGAETADLLQSFAAETDNVLLVRHDTALGYTRAANVGLKLSEAEFVVLLNSDTVVTTHWIEKLMDVAFSKPHIGLVGPLSNAASNQSLPDHRSTPGQTAVNDLPPGMEPDDMNAWCEAHARADGCVHAPLVHGFCLGVTRALIDRIGVFDEENFKLGYGEEDDYCFRAVDAGFALAIATHTFVYHAKTQSYGADRRKALSKAGNTRLRELHSSVRVDRATRNLAEDPELVRLRTLCAALHRAGPHGELAVTEPTDAPGVTAPPAMPDGMPDG
ncbi:glycosyltransferase [Prosthecodimorpha staleyi]|uniref:Glycosyltransferase n=1 Tax=Prosthecodimorpha staleyi TaxID=2840188 RepID=A0A947DAE1_9HYPH|nr:glycosyltransferase [Prosthecodimorpha staleyi]MBT9290099.1 glycosyltransferase [Prosthecodimorpha staleyi]